jgi:hypothetical protein
LGLYWANLAAGQDPKVVGSSEAGPASWAARIVSREGEPSLRRDFEGADNKRKELDASLNTLVDEDRDNVFIQGKFRLHEGMDL